MENKFKEIRRLVILFAVLLAAALNIKVVWNIVCVIFHALVPVIAGLSVAFILNVPLLFCENHVFAFMDNSKSKFVRKAKFPVCVIVTLLFACALVALVLAIVIPEIIEAIKRITTTIDIAAISNETSAFLSKIGLSPELIKKFSVSGTKIIEFLIGGLDTATESILGTAAGITMSVLGTAADVLFALVIAIYTLVCKKKIRLYLNKILDRFAKQSVAHNIRHISKTAFSSFNNFVAGQFIENIILGMLCFIGMTIFQFPYAAVVSVIVGAAQFIPIVGGWISALAGGLLMLSVSPLTAATFILFVIIIQQLEGNLIYPKVVGNKVGLPGVLVIIAVAVGTKLFGLVGAIISVPVMSTLFALLKEQLDVNK